jgi:hypothetical protein
MVIVNVDAAVRCPTSEICVQKLPGFSVTVICGVEPATAEVVELVSAQPEDPFGVPMPSPMAIVAVGLSVVSVMLTVPAFVTVNMDEAEPRRPMGPENVSVVVVGEVGELESLFRRPQPALRMTNPITAINFTRACLTSVSS